MILKVSKKSNKSKNIKKHSKHASSKNSKTRKMTIRKLKGGGSKPNSIGDPNANNPNSIGDPNENGKPNSIGDPNAKDGFEQRKSAFSKRLGAFKLRKINPHSHPIIIV
jgi:hypothetical protein